MSKKHRKRGRPLSERNEQRHLVLSWIELGVMTFEQLGTVARLGVSDYTREYRWLIHSQWVARPVMSFGEHAPRLTPIGKQALVRWARTNDAEPRPEEEHAAQG